MAFAGRHEAHHHVDLGGSGALGATRIRHQGRQAHPGFAVELVHELRGIGKLRNGARRYEGGGLETAYARIDQRIDDRGLALGGNELGLDLKAVAGTDLGHQDRAIGGIGG